MVGEKFKKSNIIESAEISLEKKLSESLNTLFDKIPNIPNETLTLVTKEGKHLPVNGWKFNRDEKLMETMKTMDPEHQAWFSGTGTGEQSEEIKLQNDAIVYAKQDILNLLQENNSTVGFTDDYAVRISNLPELFNRGNGKKYPEYEITKDFEYVEKEWLKDAKQKVEDMEIALAKKN